MSDALTNNKRLLITGGAGFLGSHVIDQLRQKGYTNIFAPRHADFDLTREAAVEAVYARARPAVVIHLASVVGGIGANQRYPGQYFYDNLIMGALLMEYARRSGVERFVGIGTICSYPKFTPVPFREDDLWLGYPEETNAPYGLAKKMLLVQAQAYRRQYDFCAIHLMPTNLYGPHDNIDVETSHVIPALIRKCLEALDNNEQQIVVWGDGSATRDFLFVEDAARGIVSAMERYDKADPVNLGSGVETSLGELVRLITAATGFSGRVVWDTAKPNGQPRRCVDTTRAEREFGFRAAIPLAEGIARTVAWQQRLLTSQ